MGRGGVTFTNYLNPHSKVKPVYRCFFKRSAANPAPEVPDCFYKVYPNLCGDEPLPPHECHKDDQCPGSQKCCYQCRLQCMLILPSYKEGDSIHIVQAVSILQHAVYTPHHTQQVTPLLNTAVVCPPPNSRLSIRQYVSITTQGGPSNLSPPLYTNMHWTQKYLPSVP